MLGKGLGLSLGFVYDIWSFLRIVIFDVNFGIRWIEGEEENNRSVSVIVGSRCVWSFGDRCGGIVGVWI